MKRYYLSSISGNGTDESEYRPTVADYVGSWSGAIPSNPKTGHPTQSWVLVSVTDADQSALVGVTGVDILPDYPLVGSMSGMTGADSLMVYQALEAHGISTTVVPLCPTYGDLLARLQQSNLAAPSLVSQLTL